MRCRCRGRRRADPPSRARAARRAWRCRCRRRLWRARARGRRWSGDELATCFRPARRCWRCRSAVIISTIWRRRATRSARSWVASSGRGRTAGLVASTKRAMTAASIGSVLARLPSAVAKARTWAGLTTATGRPALARPAATMVSKPPVASTATRAGASFSQPVRQAGDPRPAALHREGLPARQDVNIQPVLRHVDPNVNGALHRIPSLRNRARNAAQATVRVQWNDGGAATLRFGLKRPWMSRHRLRRRTGELTR